MISCKTHLNSDKKFKLSDGHDLTLRLHVISGETISYYIVSQNTFNVELNSKKIDNSTKAEITVNYTFRKDSL